jgi:penicillin-insensitive murein DD-endopeptidase
VLRPVRLLALALALVALTPAVAGAEGAADHARPRTHGHAQKARRHHRRAQVQPLAGRAPRGGGHLTPKAPKPAPKLRRPTERPESVGAPNEGHLKGGAHLDMSRPHFRLVPLYETGDVRWALPVMIQMIDRAARVVHKRFPGAVLDVGDLSQKGGGDVLRHHSHESGRDADLGFYALDKRGRQVHGRTFVKFGPDLASPNYPGARFDLARNWAFIQELLAFRGARISHIFIAEWLKRELLAYARPRVSRALYDRAAIVMMQPHNSLPHDDHIHVRISCPRATHSSCIELAKVRHKTRVAKKTRGGHPLRTPHRHAHAPPGHRQPKLAAATPQDPFALPPTILPDEPDPADDDLRTDD